MNEQEIRFRAYLAALTAWAAVADSDDADKWAAQNAEKAVARFREASSSEAAPWTGHARVELLGHRSYLGRIREVERYGAHMGEVQELLPSGEYGDVHQFGGKGVYEIRSVSLEDALKELRPPKRLQCHTCGLSIRTLNWGDADYLAPPRETCAECNTDCRKCQRFDRDLWKCELTLPAVHERKRGAACESFQEGKNGGEPQEEAELPFDGQGTTEAAQ